MKKLFSLVLALAMVLGALGCAPAFAGEAETVFDITWMPAGGSGSYVQLDSITEKWLEEKYNVNLTIYQVQANNAEQTNLMLAANDIPDVAFLYKGASEMYEMGLIRSIPETMIREYMPDYAAFLDANSYGWTINKYPDGDGGFVEGEYAAISGYNGANSGYHWSPMFRYDWLENLGIEAPGEVIEIADGIFWTKESYNMDQFTEIVKAFRDQDPDGNGTKDTYGLSGTTDGSITYLYYIFGGALGLRNMNNFMEDGEIKPYYMSNGYKNVLSYLSDMAKNDYLDPEIITQDYMAYWEKFTSGQAGIMLLNRTYLETRFSDRPPYSLLSRDPEAKILVTGPIVDEEGNGGSVAYNDIPFNYTTYISHKVEDDKLAKILTMLNDITSDEETFVTVTYGFPGETFDWEGEPWESAAMLKSSMSTETKGLYAVEAFSVFSRRPEFTKFLNNSAIDTLWQYANSEEGLSKTYLINEYSDFSYQFTQELSDYNDFYKAELDAVISEFRGNALTGADVEANWEAYINELKSRANIDEYLDMLAQFDSAVEWYGLQDAGLNVGK